VQPLHAAHKVGPQAKRAVSLGLKYSADTAHERILRQPAESRFDCFALFKRRPCHYSADTSLVAGNLRDPVGLLRELPRVTVALHEHHLGHQHGSARALIVGDQMSAIQLRHTREPRITQPAKIPEVKVRVDDRK
jgi:hypothetical protein